MKRKLFLSKDLNLSPEKIALMSHFCLFCCEYLPINGDFLIYVVNNRDDHGIGTTAYYSVGKNEIKIYGKNRALVDILRSIAHELTHMMQDEQGLITGPVQDAGGFHEDQANAKAGELIKLYAKQPGKKAIYESIAKQLS